MNLAFGLFSTFLLKALVSLFNTNPLVVVPLEFVAPALLSARFTQEAVIAEMHWVCTFMAEHWS